ncbi:hypothetical protein V865_004192 [Kwoniella europaea PYCC6329]|uniref:Uncharacterized protein n=1 Tax=Kwoniella europaea PYCC6329 TaxID=1423913 RepID=A0AAX4KI23_9TREE
MKRNFLNSYQVGEQKIAMYSASGIVLSACYTIFLFNRLSFASSKSSGVQAGSSSEIAPGKNIAFHLKDTACALLGVATLGTHMTAYEGEGEDLKVWVPTRS